MKKFNLEELMATVDESLEIKFNTVQTINIDAAGITKENLYMMIAQAKSIYESEEKKEVTTICTKIKDSENLFAYSFLIEGDE